MASRACETLIKHCTGTFEVFRLKDAASALRQRIAAHSAATASIDVRSCNTCKQTEQHEWNGVVADAGQFFETVSPTDVDIAMNHVIQIAKQQGKHPCITVKSAKHRVAFFGLGGQNFTQGQHTFHTEDIRSCIAASARMSLASVGNAVVETHVIPIGGFMSKACCSLVLGAAEDVWVRRGLANKRGYIPESACWSDHVVSARYVDDTLMMSRVMCKDCMLKALTELTHVKFDPVECDRILPWLDFKNQP